MELVPVHQTETSDHLAIPLVESPSEEPKAFDQKAVNNKVLLSHMLFAMGVKESPDEIVVRLQARIRSRLAITRKKDALERKAAEARKLAAEKALAEARERAATKSMEREEARAMAKVAGAEARAAAAIAQEGGDQPFHSVSPPRRPLSKPASPGFIPDPTRSYAGAWDAKRAREAELYALGLGNGGARENMSPAPLYNGELLWSPPEGGLGGCVSACMRSILHPGRQD